MLCTHAYHPGPLIFHIFVWAPDAARALEGGGGGGGLQLAEDCLLAWDGNMMMWPDA